MRKFVKLVGKFNLRMSADNSVMVASEPLSLQRMIYYAKCYVSLNYLTVRFERMVFRRGGKVTKNDIRYLMKKRTDLTRKYKYLNIPITPIISTNKHLVESRLERLKCTIN